MLLSRIRLKPVADADPTARIRATALAVIDRALRLDARGNWGRTVPGLSACLDQARTLRQAIADSPADRLPPEAEQLAGGRHALASLLTVVDGVEGLSDSQWAAHHAAITEAFGGPLAVAAARGTARARPRSRATSEA